MTIVNDSDEIETILKKSSERKLLKKVRVDLKKTLMRSETNCKAWSILAGQKYKKRVAWHKSVFCVCDDLDKVFNMSGHIRLNFLIPMFNVDDYPLLFTHFY